MRYSDDFRASAVLMLEAAGYPHKKGALMDVANHIGVPHATLSRWFRHKSNPAPHEIVQIKKAEIVDMLKSEVHAILMDMPHARPDADFRELGTVLGIIIDKLQLLDGEPTERIEYELSDSDRSEQVAALLDRARERAARQPPPPETLH